jgi:hypothetical protein
METTNRGGGFEMSATDKRASNSHVAKTEKRTITLRQSRRSLTSPCLLAFALLLGAMASAVLVRAQTCPLEDPAILAAKNNYLYLYFPTMADPTFPAYPTPGGTLPTASPVAPFDVSALTSGIGTTAQLIDAIKNVVADDYCEFNVQVLTTTTNPATLASPPAQRVTVGIGDDINGDSGLGYFWGQAQEVDTGNTIAVDFARVWAGTYTTCEGGAGPPDGGACTAGALTGANNTLNNWAQAIGGTAAHEAGHTYGLAHTDDDPPPCPATPPCDDNEAGPTPTPGEDPYYQHLMPAGLNLTASQRADYRRHFSNRTYGLLATNVGLSVETMHNWTLINPNAEAGSSLTIAFLSTLSSVPISWFYNGNQSPWLNPTVSGPSGMAVFQGTTYNEYTITWSSPNPAWSSPSPGIVGGGVQFHIGATFTGVNFDTPDPILIQNVTLFDASSNPLALHPRLAGYDAGTLDSSSDSMQLHFFPAVGAPDLRLQSAEIYQLPRVASIDSMVGDGRPMTYDKLPIVPWSVTKCAAASLRDGVTCTVAKLTQEPHVKETFLVGQPGVYDCSQGLPTVPRRNPNPKVSFNGPSDSSRPLDYEGPICAGSQTDPFPSATVYVIAKFVDPAAKHWDPASKQYVVGPVTSTTYYQFAGTRQGESQSSSSSLQYAAKFLCGRMERNDRGKVPSQGREAVAAGDYHTAINVHNPSNRAAAIRFKFASALRDGRSGTVSPFAEIKLGPDQTISLDCAQVYELLRAKPGFIDGFAVIESNVELEVVAVYTAAGENGQVATMQTERVPVRKIH